MPFPIMYPAGALIAGLLLGAALTLFAIALRALDRAVTRVGDSILSGLVSGFHGWSDERQRGSRSRSPRAADAEDTASPVGVEPVHRR